MSAITAGPKCRVCHVDEAACARTYPCCDDCRHTFGGGVPEVAALPFPVDPAVLRLREARRHAIANRDDQCLPDNLIDTALRLVAAVRTRSTEAVQQALTGADLRRLAVCLAALVPDGCSAAELLAWNDSHYAIETIRELRPHGTHAAHTRHRSAGEAPCEACVLGERAYQRQRHLRRKSVAVSVPVDGAA